MINKRGKMKYLLTGGTGSLGNAFVDRMINDPDCSKLIIYSRDEFKQSEMKKKYSGHEFKEKLRFFLGDVRDSKRLKMALSGVDIVIHAAALKQVPAGEYDPSEFIKTNVMGAMNLIEASIEKDVKKIVALSTDKAVNPINLYGASKLCSDRLFLAANCYNQHRTKISLVRYGNVAGSRGSVIPFFKQLIDRGEDFLPITDPEMTRFWITLDEAVDTVLFSLAHMQGGETFIKKIPSFRIVDLVSAFEKLGKIIVCRESEKLHEKRITEFDNVYNACDYFCIYPKFEWYNPSDYINPFFKKLDPFEYESSENTFMSVEDIRKKLIQLGYVND
jgi:FlaA1/EpsC-like NDP-sugar epimerase